MAKKSEQLTLEELRDKSSKSKTKLSFAKEMGGYNKKQVSDYIDNLMENLENAEESFNNRLEEYAAMITMLKQERDQYGEMYNLCKASKFEMSNQIDEIKKENDTLNQLINERNLNYPNLPTQHINTDTSETAIELPDKLAEYLAYEQESQEMKAQLDQLKAMVRELNTELETYARENSGGDDVKITTGENTQNDNQVLKSQYEDILRERKALLIEKNRLAEENHKLTEKVADLKRHLKTSNERYDKQIKELDANVNLFIENHYQLIDNNQ